MTDETEPENFNATIRRRPPPGRLGRRLLESWGVELDDGDDADPTADDRPPPPAA